MLGFSQQHDAGVGSNAMIGRVDLDRTVESRLKKSTLYIAHRVHPVLTRLCRDRRLKARSEASQRGHEKEL